MNRYYAVKVRTPRQKYGMLFEDVSSRDIKDSYKISTLEFESHYGYLEFLVAKKKGSQFEYCIFLKFQQI